MRLQKMTILNFKGIGNLEIESPSGENLNIYADNALGKTTILDAFLWLLFDKDSSGAKDFNIKTLDKNGQAIPMIDHSVEAVFSMHDTAQYEITLKKTYLEKYTKKRGSADRVFDGHITEYSINGVPKTKGEYQAFIESIAPEKTFRMLTSPTYFAQQVHWQERRKFLVDAFGSNITWQDIMTPELEPLAGRLSQYSIDDLKKMETASRKKINEELNGIPGRIDEATRAIPDHADGNAEAAARVAQRAAAELEALTEEKARILTGGQLSELQRQIAEVDTAIITMRNEQAGAAQQVLGDKLAAERERLADLNTQLSKVIEDCQAPNQAILKNGAAIAALKDEQKKLVPEWKRLKSLVFSRKGSCPTCGQSYPEHLSEQEESDFNRKRAEDIEIVNRRGEYVAQEAMEARAGKEKAEALLEELYARSSEIKDEISSCQTTISGILALQGQPVDVSGLPAYIELKKKRDGLETQIVALRENIGPATIAIDEKIAGKRSELNEANRIITMIETASLQRRRIEDLKAREKELAKAFEESERTLFLIEQFLRAQISTLEKSINSRFATVSWKMFDEQINGGMTETCVATIGGVPYPDLNNAAKIQAGCDIIHALANHIGFHPCVWIDNRESVTSLPKLDGQVISLIVSESDKSLRIVEA